MCCKLDLYFFLVMDTTVLYVIDPELWLLGCVIDLSSH